MVALLAAFVDASGDPVSALANAPTIQIRRTDTGAIVQAFTAMTFVGDGTYRYDYTIPSTTESYSFVVDGDPTASGQVPDSQVTKSGSFSGLIDANETAINTNLDAQVSDVEADTQDIQSRLPAALVSGRIDADVGNMQTDVVDADALAADAVAEIADGIWDEDVVAAHGTADTAGLLVRALGADISQRTNNPTLNALLGVVDAAGRDIPEQVDLELQVLHGSGSWEGASAAATATAVWSEALPGAFGAGEAGNIVGNRLDAAVSSRATQADILADATPFNGADVTLILADTAAMQPLVDVAVSSRAAPGDAMTLTPAERTAIDGVLTAAHGAGAWTGGGLTQQNVRDAMKLAPTAGAPAVGSVDQHLDDIESTVTGLNDLSSGDVETAVQNALDTQGYTAARAVNLDNLDELVSDPKTLTVAERTAIAAAILSSTMDSFLTLGTVGGALATAAAHGGHDVVDDMFVFGGPPGQPTSFRRRQFSSSAAAIAARAAPNAPDGADGEIKRWKAVADYTGVGPTDTLVAMHFVEEL